MINILFQLSMKRKGRSEIGKEVHKVSTTYIIFYAYKTAENMEMC